MYCIITNSNCCYYKHFATCEYPADDTKHCEYASCSMPPGTTDEPDKENEEYEIKLDLDSLKCLRMSEARDMFNFLNTLAVKHNELVSFLEGVLSKQ